MLKRKLKLYRRFREITLELSKIGIYNIYEYFKALFGIDTEEDIRPQKIRESLEKLGPSFIKLGQILSIRPDIIPQSIIKELIKLQDSVKPIPFEEIKFFLEKEYQKPLEEIFTEIDPKPIGSASISQVYRGRLKSGEQVAIKVKRPYLEELINIDAKLFMKIISFIEKHSKFVKDLDLKSVVMQYKQTTLREADFEIEANNITTFRENFKEFNEKFYIPKYYPDFSNKNILVLEYIEGFKISSPEDIKRYNLNGKELAELITDAYYKMVFKDGFYHADPHPGNFIITKEGKVCLIDFGMVGTLPREKKKLLYEHIFAVINKNTELAMKFYEGMEMITPKTDLDKLQTYVEFFVDKYHNKTLANINLKDMVLEIIDLVRECNLKLPTSLAYLGKASIGLDGVIRVLNETFNPTERLTNFLTKSFKDRLRDLMEDTSNTVSFYYHLPLRLDKLIRTLEIERLTFRVIFKDFEEIKEFYKKQTDKLTLSILSVGFIISSGLFYISKKEDIADISLTIGFVFLAILFYKLFRDL
ncbi:MAG: AarF/UbiB family protein [Hydrogenothermaceae bacterium]